MMNRIKRSVEDLTKYEEEEVMMMDDDDGATSGSSATAGSSSTGSGFSFSGDARATCLTRELSRLPPETQQKVVQDLYGLAESEAVDPASFEQLEIEINKMKEKHAYDLALELSVGYVRNESFRLMFLRAAQGDAKRAARRLTKHFTTKLSLFGEDLLVKDIEVDDLDEYDMEALLSGGFQILPQRDRAGRSVLFGRYTSMRYRETKNMLRALWYIWMTVLEDPEDQMKGIVAIGYEVGRSPLERFDGIAEENGFDMFDTVKFNTEGGFDRDLAREIISIPLSVPARPVGYHLCTDSDQWVGIMNMVMVTLCKFVRLRMRIHHGTDQECKYALLTHGLPAESIPVTPSGDVDLTNHLHWVENRRQLETTRRTCNTQKH